MGRTRENQGIYSLNSWEKGAAVSERRKAQLHSVVQYRMFSERRNALCAITPGKIRGKIRTFKFSTAFLKACRSHRVAPKYMIARIERSKIRHSLVVERAFMNDEIEKQTKQLKTGVIAHSAFLLSENILYCTTLCNCAFLLSETAAPFSQLLRL